MKFPKTIHAILAILNAEQARKGLWILVLMVINAILDFFSVAAFLPLLAALINPEIVTSNSVFNSFYIFFGFVSHSAFVIAATIGVVVFVLLKNLISLYIAKVKARYAFTIRSELSTRALSHYMQGSFLDFTKADFTRILNTITNHPLAFANNLLLSLATILSEALVGLFILTCVVIYDYKVLLLITLILVPLLVVVIIRKKSYQKISHELKTAYPNLLKYSNQIIEGFVEIKTYLKGPFFYQKFETDSRRLTETLIKDQTLQAGTLRLTEIIVATIMCSLIIYSAVAHLQYQQTLVLLAVYAGASFRIVPSINRILHALQQIRTNEYLLDEFKVPVVKTPLAPESIVTDFTFTDSIAFQDIAFKYPDGPQALRGVTFTIRKGERIAITGASGEGKTTFLLVLLGFLPQTAGQILVDGNTIQNKNSWKKEIGYVSQNPYMLDGTIAENIAFGIPVENIDLIRVQQLIQDLGLDTLVRNLPNGVNTRIGERGAKLSGGQRQRLAFARALYADREILLLDEITNQVHGILEMEILNLLSKLADQKKTIIMVTHKIAHANFFDAIYNLEKGSLHNTAVPLTEK